MGNFVPTPAPRVPPSPNSMAARFAEFSALNDAQQWIYRWEKIGGVAGVLRQADGTVSLFLLYPSEARDDDEAAAKLPLLVEIADRALSEQVIAELGIRPQTARPI